jgi:DNA-binding transcriptional MerR regulator
MLNGPDLTIGALAQRTGCNVPTIRYYEEIGLLPRADRRAGGHRVYGQPDLRRLTLIKRCRDFGFPIEQVRTLVALTESLSRDCVEARDLAQAHLGTVRQKLKDLRALEKSLVQFVERCDATCAGGTGL